MASSRGRSTRRWRQLRANLRAERRPCDICRMPIDYDADYLRPDSFQVDHRLPLSTHPHLAEDPANLRAVHRRCNATKSDSPTDPIPQLGTTSRDW
jgi:5-methylcytosine-specific restriction endonuclease McrA